MATHKHKGAQHHDYVLQRASEYIDYLSGTDFENNYSYIYLDSACLITIYIGVNLHSNNHLLTELLSDPANFNIPLPLIANSAGMVSKLPDVFNGIVKNISKPNPKYKKGSANPLVCNMKPGAFSPANIALRFAPKSATKPAATASASASGSATEATATTGANAAGNPIAYNFSLSPKGLQLVKDEFMKELQNTVNAAAQRYESQAIPPHTTAVFPTWNSLPAQAQWWLVDRQYNMGNSKGSLTWRNPVQQDMKTGNWSKAIAQGYWKGDKHADREKALNGFLTEAKASAEIDEMLQALVAPVIETGFHLLQLDSPPSANSGSTRLHFNVFKP